ncbi:MAG: ammonium transporter [Gammaproteobacteria bacterium]|nr:ammonium transporter [Gammaproteobacteria bacterium]
MFGLLRFILGWLFAKILNAFGALRIPKEIELIGLDTAANIQGLKDEQEILSAEHQALKK